MNVTQRARMTGHKTDGWLHVLVSGLWLVCSLMVLTILSVRGRWSPLAGMIEIAVFLVLWLVWVSHLVWSLACGRLPLSRNRRLLTGIGAVLVSVIAATGLYRIGPLVLAYEIKQAINAGLQQDCADLLNQWPIEGDRIFRSTPEYDKLPISIRMLNPGYVTNDNIFSPNVPPHIGICTCGFAGFAIGVRVFQNDEEADACKSILDGRYRRIAPGVYYCRHQT